MNDQVILQLNHLSSYEHYDAEPPQAVLADIDLFVRSGETWGIYAETAFETKLLLQIVGGIRRSMGEYKLFEQLINVRKPFNIPALCYIGTSTMPYPNMNVLEYLMFMTRHIDFHFRDIEASDYLDYSIAKDTQRRAYRQEELLETLVGLGLDYLALTPLKRLYDDERAVISLLGSTYSNCSLIVFNFPEYEFPDFLAQAIPPMVKQAAENDKTVLLGLADPELIEEAASHAAYLVDGHILYEGSVDKLRYEHDKIVAYIADEQIEQIYDVLAPLLLDYELYFQNDILVVRDPNNKKESPSFVYKTMVGAGLSPLTMLINEKTVKNACEELLRHHDL